MSRTVLLLASTGLVAAGCGSSDAAELPVITATPTTVFVPETEPEVPESGPATTPVAAEPAQDETDPANTAPTTEGDDTAEQPVDTAPAAEGAASDNPLADLARAQLVAAGYSEEDATCVANNLDFDDPLVLQADPDATAPAFEACGLDPSAEPGS